MWSVVGWILAVLGTIALLGLFLVLFVLLANDARLKLRRFVRRRLSKEQRRVVDKFSVRTQPFKLEKKRTVRERLLADPQLLQDLEAYAEREGEALETVLERVVDYADEIIPFFNVVSYYRVGYTVAAIAMRAMYRVDVDDEEVARTRAFLDESDEAGRAVVFVMNHRSNADFVLVAYVLARAIALSYAVGEWARVWPLEWLFKSFGSYFVRRGCRDPAYHLTLRRYLQIITEEGVTQGIFIEGGLSRDGLLRPAKNGLLDSLSTLPERGGAPKEVWFVPVGINYDRVVEDEVLTSKLEDSGGLGSGWAYYARAMSRIGRYFFTNIPRYVMRRVRRFGYAAVRIGKPVPMTELFDGPIAQLVPMTREERKPSVQLAADRLLNRIAEVVPVTPVALVAASILFFGEDEGEDFHVTETELRARMQRLTEQLSALGAPVLGVKRGLDWQQRVGLTILVTRGHLRRAGDVIATRAATRHLVRYYANGVRHHLERVEGVTDALALADRAERTVELRDLDI